jgi:hypothetical protein
MLFLTQDIWLGLGLVDSENPLLQLKKHQYHIQDQDQSKNYFQCDSRHDKNELRSFIGCISVELMDPELPPMPFELHQYCIWKQS